jgi:hypothetical protein
VSVVLRVRFSRPARGPSRGRPRDHLRLGLGHRRAGVGNHKTEMEEDGQQIVVVLDTLRSTTSKRPSQSIALRI